MTRPLLLFAHGAGLSSTSPWMTGWAQRLDSVGDVTAFDYPYMQRGSRRPDRLPKLIEAHRQALRSVRSPDRSVVLIGKSMGSRVGCHLSLQEEVVGVICLGYPLRSASGKLRDQVLRDMRAPVLFVQGTRDRMCPLDLLDEVRQDMSAPSVVHVVETGDHSLLITRTHTRKTGFTQDNADDAALTAIRHFLADCRSRVTSPPPAGQTPSPSPAL